MEHGQSEPAAVHRHGQPGLLHRVEHRVQGAGHRPRVQPEPADRLEVSQPNQGTATLPYLTQLAAVLWIQKY